jgi:uncharacterized membrane protein YczE
MPNPVPSAAQRWTALFTRPVPNLALRVAVLLLGFAFIALGVALSRATGMGTSPISCVPAVLSFASDLSIGTYTFVLNTLFLVLQVVLLRRDFKPVQLLQLPATFVFSVLIDAFVPLAQLIPLPNYPACVALMLVSVVCTALGVFLEVKAVLVPLPGEGVSTTVSRVFGVDFSRCKLGFDITNVVVGAALSLAALHGLYGVREGTVLAALAVGPLVRLLNRLFPRMERVVPTAAPGLLFTGQSVAPAPRPAVPEPAEA